MAISKHKCFWRITAGNRNRDVIGRAATLLGRWLFLWARLGFPADS